MAMNNVCKKIRFNTLKMIYSSKSGHPGASMSEVEILYSLYFNVMNINKDNYRDKNRDRFVLSKGHGAPTLYSILMEKGIIPEKEANGFRKINSLLQGHPYIKIPGVESVSGSLGGGFSNAVGMAKGIKILGGEQFVFSLLGDGEINEGIIWEAAMAATKYELDNLIAILDRNRFQNDGACADIMPLHDVKSMFSSFGFETDECDGHNIDEISSKLMAFKTKKNRKPKILIANTIKGYGVSYLERDYKTHYVPPTEEQWKIICSELG
jgi:transketolase